MWESLLWGQPPVSDLRTQTAGDIGSVTGWLKQEPQGLFQICGDQGAGKSHLLRLLAEQAKAAGYAVCILEYWPGEAGFESPLNWIGQVWQHLELPDSSKKGPSALFEKIQTCLDQGEQPLGDPFFWEELSSHGSWSGSDILESPWIYLALRAWLHLNVWERREIVDLLCTPQNLLRFQKQHWQRWVADLRLYFRDPCPYSEWKAKQLSLTSPDALLAGFRDLQVLLRVCGYRGGLVLLDGFDRALLALKNEKDLRVAWGFLHSLSHVDQVLGPLVMTVLNGFSDQLTRLLLQWHCWELDLDLLDQLPSLALPHPTAQAWFNWFEQTLCARELPVLDLSRLKQLSETPNLLPRQRIQAFLELCHYADERT